MIIEKNIFIKRLWAYQIRNWSDLLTWLFCVSFYVNSKLVHFAVGNTASLTIYCILGLLSFAPLSKVYFFQVVGVYIIFYLLATGLSIYIIAKIPFLRSRIDKVLSIDFIVYHKLNPETQKKLVFFCLGCYALHTGDTMIAKKMNAQFVSIETQTAIDNNLPLPSRSRIEFLHDRPGILASKIEEMVNKFGKPKE